MKKIKVTYIAPSNIQGNTFRKTLRINTCPDLGDTVSLKCPDNHIRTFEVFGLKSWMSFRFLWWEKEKIEISLRNT